MDMIKIAMIGVVGVLIALFLKGMKSPLSTYVSLAVSLLILFYAVSKLEFLISSIKEISQLVSVKTSYITTLIKIIGITYVAEFSTNICKDAGFQTVAGQIEVFSKLSVLSVSMPVLMALFQTIQSFLK